MKCGGQPIAILVAAAAAVVATGIISIWRNNPPGGTLPNKRMRASFLVNTNVWLGNYLDNRPDVEAFCSFLDLAISKEVTLYYAISSIELRTGVESDFN